MAKFCVQSDVRLSLQLMLLQIAVSHDSAGIYTGAFIAGLAAEHGRLLEELEGVDSQPDSPTSPSPRPSRSPSTDGKLEGMRAGMTSAIHRHSVTSSRNLSTMSTTGSLKDSTAASYSKANAQAKAALSSDSGLSNGLTEATCDSVV